MAQQELFASPVRETKAPSPDGTFQFTLFGPAPNIDVRLVSPSVATATLIGSDLAGGEYWLRAMVPGAEPDKDGSRTFLIPIERLDRLLCVAKPAQVTLDPGARAVAQSLWAYRLGLSPLRVRRAAGRLITSSPRWPGLRCPDVPWMAVLAILRLGMAIEVAPGAQKMLVRRMSAAGESVAKGRLAGSMIELVTKYPNVVESLAIPALMYSEGKESGRYRVPIRCAKGLLDMPGIQLTRGAQGAIRRACKKGKRRALPDWFPWTLDKEQQVDVNEICHLLECVGAALVGSVMGTGKTIVSTGAVAALDRWPIVIVVTSAGAVTWEIELEKTNRSVYMADKATDVIRKDLNERHYDAVIVTYDTLPRLVELLGEFEFGAVIADEVQACRTPRSRRSRALRSIMGYFEMRLFVSGTPFQNYERELLCLMGSLLPGDIPFQVSGLSRNLFVDDHIDGLRDILHSVMVRMTWERAGIKLPPVYKRRHRVKASKAQVDALNAIDQEITAEKANGELIPAKYVHIFKRISTKRAIHNIPIANKPHSNPKLTKAVRLAAKWKESGQKSIIFVDDIPAYEAAAKLCEEKGLKWVGIRGSVAKRKRRKVVDSYLHDDDVFVFIGMLRACSESITLSPAARLIVFATLHYNPMVMAQGEARAVRRNMTHPVTIVYLTLELPDNKQSQDDRMWEIGTSKRELFDYIVDKKKRQDKEVQATSFEKLMYILDGSKPEAPLELDLTIPQSEETVVAETEILDSHVEVDYELPDLDDDSQTEPDDVAYLDRYGELEVSNALPVEVEASNLVD